jgi:hypothetical protein
MGAAGFCSAVVYRSFLVALLLFRKTDPEAEEKIHYYRK